MMQENDELGAGLVRQPFELTFEANGRVLHGFIQENLVMLHHFCFRANSIIWWYMFP